MASILSLAMKVTADAGDLPERLSPVDKALVNLGKQAASVAGLFDQFTTSTGAAGDAQKNVQAQLDALTASLKAGEISAQQYSDGFNAIQASAREAADTFRQGAQTTAQFATEQEKAAGKIAAFANQLKLGAIEGPTFQRALEAIAGTDLGSTDQGRQLIERLAASAKAGGLDAQEAAKDLLALGQSGTQLGDSLEQPTLKLNELSGVFAVLPGPLGEIAGRFSGIVSAGEGLGRVFAGGNGLNNLFGGLGQAVAALSNPFTLAVAGIAAFSAAATAITNGLATLEGRVESLGNTADKLGVSFGFIQVLEEAANRSGTSIDAVSAAFGRLQKNVTGVDEESKSARDALESIGVTAKEIQDLAPEEQYLLIGERLADIEDPAKRSATATQLFGKAGADLLPFFNNISKAEADMQRFGATISDLDRSRLDSLGDGFDQIGLAVSALGQNVLLPFAGFVEGVSKALSAVINVISLVADALGAVLQPVLDAVGAAFGAFGDAVNNTIGYFRSFFATANETENATSKIADGIERSAEEMKDLSRAIEQSEKSLDAAITKAGEFGQAGFDAALEFQQAIEDLQEQVDDGELNAEQYARGVALATAEYEKQIDTAREVAEQNKQLAEEAQRRAEAEQKANQKLLEDNKKIADTLLEQQRIQEEFGGDTGRAKAAENVKAIEQEILRVEQELQAARDAGDKAGADAAAARIAKLDQVLAQEQDIASGAAAERERERELAEEALEEQERLAAEREKKEEEIRRLVEKNAEDIAAKQEELINKTYDLEKQRVEEINNLRGGGIEVGDIRSSEGANQFLDLLGGKQDEAIAEYRKSVRELQSLRKDIQKLEAQRVEILGGVG